MVNIKKFPRGILDQAISGKNSTECKTRSPGPGLKRQASSAKLRYTPTGILLGVDLGPRPQAASKPEPSSGSQASSHKPQARRHKPQASSRKPQAPRS